MEELAQEATLGAGFYLTPWQVCQAGVAQSDSAPGTMGTGQALGLPRLGVPQGQREAPVGNQESWKRSWPLTAWPADGRAWQAQWRGVPSCLARPMRHNLCLPASLLGTLLVERALCCPAWQHRGHGVLLATHVQHVSWAQRTTGAKQCRGSGQRAGAAALPSGESGAAASHRDAQRIRVGSAVPVVLSPGVCRPHISPLLQPGHLAQPSGHRPATVIWPCSTTGR